MARALCSLVLLAAACALAAQAPHIVQTAVAPGSPIELDLEAGAYDVVPTDAAQVQVSWTEPAEARTRVDLSAKGGVTKVRVRNTPHKNFTAHIEVPRRCDLKVHLSAGELKIGAVEGNKDLRNRAGEVHVAVPDPAAYGAVNASVWAGEIHATAFGGAKEGLFRSFHHQGPGNLNLRVKVMAGEVHLGH